MIIPLTHSSSKKISIINGIQKRPYDNQTIHFRQLDGIYSHFISSRKYVAEKLKYSYGIVNQLQAICYIIISFTAIVKMSHTSAKNNGVETICVSDATESY